LQEPEGDQPGSVDSQGARKGGQHKHDTPPQEDTPAPPMISDLTHGHQKSSRSQQVGHGDPAHGSDVQVQFSRQLRQVYIPLEK